MLRAVMSVWNKDGLVEFARALFAHFHGDLMILSTGGTAKTLKEAKLQVTDVASFTGSPEVMDGRVKTIHPKIAGGILARRDRADDMEALTNKLQSAPIDLVVVNLYPFAKVAADPTKSFDELIENIDIGGPSLVRAAAKNFRDVAVVVDTADYANVARGLTSSVGLSKQDRFALARKAFAHTAEYDAKIAYELVKRDPE